MTNRLLISRPVFFQGMIICFLLLFGHAYAAEEDSLHFEQAKALFTTGHKLYSKGDNVGALENLIKAEILSQKHKLGDRANFLIKLNLGNIYAAMSNFGEGSRYFKEALAIARNSRELGDENLSLVYVNLGRLYYYESDYKTAIEYFSKSYGLKGKSDSSTAITGVTLALSYNMLSKPARAKQYLDEIKDLPKDPEMDNLWRITFAEALFLEGRLPEAETMMQPIISRLNSFVAKDQDVSNIVYINGTELLAKIYAKQNNFSLAIAYAKKGLKASLQMKNRRDFYAQVSGLYAEAGDFRTALQYKDSVVIAKDSIAALANRELFESNKVKLRLQEYQGELKYQAEKHSSERRLLYLIIIAIIGIVVVVVLFLRQKRLVAERNRQAALLELEKEKNENHILERKIIDQEIQAQLEEERLKDEIQSRNRKLSAKALYLSGRNELIEEIVTAIAESPRLAKVPALAKHVKELRDHLKSDDEWDSFIMHFEEVNPGFINRLKEKHPSLNANDVRFIVYLYMNLSLKEIAAMLNITHESCRKRKERISAKLDLPENTSIYHYISMI